MGSLQRTIMIFTTTTTYFLVLIFLQSQNIGFCKAKPNLLDGISGIRFLLPDLIRGESADENLVIVPDPTFSPVVLLVGEDENNQTDLVVVGKNTNNSEAAEILEKFIQSLVNNESPVEESRSVYSHRRHQTQLDISQGTEELNHTLEDYQYFDSDFDFDQLLISSHQEDGANIDKEDDTNIDKEDDTNIDKEDGANIDKEDGANIDKEDGANIDNIDNEYENTQVKKKNLTYTYSDIFRSNFNPPKGFRVQEGRRSRRAK